MKTVEKIHSKGKNLFSFPYKVYYAENDTEETRLIISVPKKIYKRAVRRNLIRRRIREAYRLNINQFSDHVKGRDIILVYVSPEILEYGRISETLTEALRKI